VLKFQRKLAGANSPLLVDVMKADAVLAREGCARSWTAELARALGSIADQAGCSEQGIRWQEAALEGRVIEDGSTVLRGAVLAQLKIAYRAVAWDQFEGIEYPRAPSLPEGITARKFLTYHCWFRDVQQQSFPEYLRGPASLHHELTQLARFRLGSHALGVEKGRHQRVAWQDRRCTRCPAEHLGQLSCAVDDEEHAIFDCVGFQQLRIVTPGVISLLLQCPRDVRAFMHVDQGTVRKFASRLMDKLDQMAAEERLPG
jgi:hypothetical protein